MLVYSFTPLLRTPFASWVYIIKVNFVLTDYRLLSSSAMLSIRIVQTACREYVAFYM